MNLGQYYLELGVPSPGQVANQILGELRRNYAPPPELKVSEFAEESIVLTSGPLAGTRWRNGFAPYQIGIMDAFHEPGVEVVAVMGSSQWGKTSIAVNLVAYHMRHDPAPTMVVEPTVDPMALDFARNRLDPVIRASADLAELFPSKRSKDATNRTLEKTYRGGFVVISGAGSPASLAARAIRILILDEVDRYPIEAKGEGNTIAIAMKRTTSWRRRRRILMLSSPTLVEAPIHAWHSRGDQRLYFVPCPKCGTFHPYEWQQVRWTNEDPTTARIHCPACDHGMTDAERIAVLDRGEWRAQHPERLEKGVVSFHLWEAYSPLSSLADIVTGFIRARRAQKSGDRSEMHTWINTTLGQPVEAADGEGAEPHVLLARARSARWTAEVPQGAVALTMGVDTQDDRLEALVIGWDRDEQSWIVDRLRYDVDTSKPEAWAWLDQQIDKQYQHESGVPLQISAVSIDSAGHRTTEVYKWAYRKLGRRVFAIIGRDGQRPIISSPSRRSIDGSELHKVNLYTVGVDAAKSRIVPRLNVTDQGPGYVHLPDRDWVDEELCLQLTSERLVKRWSKGVPVTEWVAQRARNEALDCFVYALHALHMARPDWPALEKALERKRQRLEDPTPPAAPATPKKPKWVPRRPGGWLKGRE